MPYHQDWFMRQIEALIRFVAFVLFKKDIPGYVIEDEAQVTATDMLYREIAKLIAEKRICEAENLLFEQLDAGVLKHLELALDFYYNINLLSDEELEQSNFSRDEIKEGLHSVMKKFGVQDLSV